MDDEMYFWEGRNLEELSKEELIEALKTMARLYHSVRESFQKMTELAII